MQRNTEEDDYPSWYGKKCALCKTLIRSVNGALS